MAVGVGALLPVRTASAVVEGMPPRSLQSFQVFGDGLAIGNTLMASQLGTLEVNSVLLEESSADLSGVPQDANPQKVFLWWSGSLAQGQGSESIDRDALITLTDGASQNVMAEDCQPITTFGFLPLTFFYCRADVTTLVTAHPGMFTWNGRYTVGDVVASPGQVLGNNCSPVDPHCQAKYAGWSLIFVYDSPSATLQRDVKIFDGFLHLDETATSLGTTSFTIDGFLVGSPASAQITYFGMEGDRFLGAGPDGHCQSCPDFFSVNGTSLRDSLNHEGNVFNSSIALGLDLDTFNIGADNGAGLPILKTGDTTATITTGTGDNILNTSGSTGESIFLGWTLLRLNRPSPNFRGNATKKLVDQASAPTGSSLSYSVNVANQGALNATDVAFTDTMPSGLAYVANSVQVDGKPCTDAADADACTVTSGTVTVKLGSINFTGDNDRAITFRGTLTATGAGTTVCNVAQVVSVETPTAAELGPACTQVTTATLGKPQKTVTDFSGGVVGPGGVLQYTVNIPGDSGSPIQGVTFTDNLPPHVRLLSPPSGPGGATSESTAPGGGGAEQVKFSGITIPAGGSAQISFTVRVDTEAEFAAKGVPSSQIHGRQICNQGSVSVPFLPSPVDTDSNLGTDAKDATCTTLTFAALLGGAQKSAVDDNGSPLVPGDTITYTVSLVNSGNRQGTIDLVDSLPAGVGNFTLLTPIVGSTFTPAPAGDNGMGLFQVTGLQVSPNTTTTLRFRVTLLGSADDAMLVQNRASMTVAENSAENRVLVSEALTVTSRPNLSDLTKAVSDPNGGSVEPGDFLSYTLAVTNNGNRAATSVVLSDPISPHLTNVVVTAGSGAFDAGARTITWTRASLGVGETLDAAFTARVISPLASGTQIVNQASIDSVESPSASVSDDPATGTADDPTVVTVVSAPNLSTAEKTVVDLNGAPVEPGDSLEYSITLSNMGTAAGANVVVTDVVDADLTSVTPLDGGTLAGNTLTWSLGTLNPGGSRTVRFAAVVRTPLLSGTTISNQAQITTPELPGQVATDDPTTVAVDDPTRVTVVSQANLSTSTLSLLDLNGGAIQPGDTLRYTVAVANTGNSPATGLTGQVVVDPRFSSVVAESGGVFDAATRTITWNLSSLSPGAAPVQVTFRATLATPLANGTSVCETATLDSEQSGPQTTAPLCAIVESRPDFANSEKTVVDNNGGQVVPGDTLTYDMAVKNEGTQDGTAVTIRDVIDAHLTTVLPQNGGVFDPTTRTITWILPSVAAKTTTVLRVTAVVENPLDTGTIIPNQATVTCNNGCPGVEVTDDPLTAAADDATSVVVTSLPVLLLKKTFADDDGGELDPGDNLTYALAITNTGTSCADNVQVTDALDPNLSFLAADQGGVFAAGQVSWIGGTTPALSRLCTGLDRSVTLTLRTTVKTPLDDGTLICNRAQARSDEVPTAALSDDPSTATAGDATCRAVVSGAILSGATKIVSDPNGAPTRPGDLLTYTIQFTNEGNAVAENVTVRDVISPLFAEVTVGNGGTRQGAELRWNASSTPSLAQVAVGQTVTLTYSAKLASPIDNGTPIPNQAEISAGKGLKVPVLTDNPSTPESDDSTLVLVTSSAKMAAEKVVGDENGGSFAPGDTFLYTITLRNAGDAIARNLAVTDTLTSTLSLVQALDGGQVDATGRTVTWSLSNVAPGLPVSVRLRAKAQTPLANGTRIANQATFTLEGDPTIFTSDDPSTAEVGDATALTIVSAPKFAGSTKTVTGQSPEGTATPGTLLHYAIVVLNQGDAIANQIVVSDPIDTAHLDVTLPLDGGVFNPATGLVTWAISDLAPGATRTVRFEARVRADVPDGVSIANQARVTSAEVGTPALTDDPATALPTDPTRVVTSAKPVLSVAKRVVDGNGAPVAPADTLEYSITISVAGPAHAYDVAVTDPLSPLLTSVVPGEGGKVSGSQIEWNAQTTPALQHLAPGSPITLTFRAKVSSQAQDRDTIANQALVAAAAVPAVVLSDDPLTAQPGDATVVEVVARPLLEVTKAVVDDNGGKVLPGDVLTYTIRVENLGTATSLSTFLFDPLPPFTEYVGDSTRLKGIPLSDVEGRSLLQIDRGVPIGSASVGGDPGTSDLLVGAKNGVTVVWKVRVREDALFGSVVSNQAIATNARGDVSPSDDPRTSVAKDPTQVVVGGGPVLLGTTKTYDPTPINDDGNRRFDPGEIIQYQITVPNSGDETARGVVVSDPIPVGTEYVAGSLRLDGELLTDPEDGDVGHVVGRLLTVRVGDVAAQGLSRVAFRVRILAADTVVTNQGVVDAEGVAKESTDSDGNDINGDQPTLTPVGSAPPLLIVKSVEDINGNEVLAGDALLYTVKVTNLGVVEHRIDGRDTLAEPLEFLEGSVTWEGSFDFRGPGLLSFEKNLDPGETATLSFRARVKTGDLGPLDGEEICNQVEILLPNHTQVSEPACVTVGAVAGSGRLEGRAYIEGERKDHVFQEGADELLAGWQIQLYHSDEPNRAPLMGLTTDKEGKYRINAVPPGEYVLRAFTPEGVQLGMIGHIVVASGKVTEQDVWIDPSGRVYDSVSGLYQQGVQVFLYYDEEDPSEPGKQVPDDQLGPMQQGQVTGAMGVYGFDVKPGRKYRLVVDPEAAGHAFPSVLIPPAPGFAPPGPVVLHPPSLDPKKSRKYYLRFAPNGVDDDVTNNHIPIDPLTSLLRLEKRADRPQAVVGDIVNYTITVENRSTRNFVAAEGNEVWLVDTPARGLSVLRGQAAAQIRKGGVAPVVLSLELGAFQERPTALSGGPELAWGPFDLVAGATLTLHYQVAIGLDTRQGTFRNRAVLKDAARVVDLSNTDEVALRVEQDPIFDQGLLLGRVYCDEDGDQRRDANEPGVMGARVYIDSGSYARTDATGKWHLSRIDSGVHLVKIDDATLPGGSTLRGEASQVVFFTRGMPHRVDFAVKCVSERVDAFDTAGSIKLSGKTQAGRASPSTKLPKTSTTVVGDLVAMTVAVDGQPIDLPLVDFAIVVPPELALPVAPQEPKDKEGAPNLASPAPKGYEKHKPIFRGKLRGKTAQVVSSRLSIWRLESSGDSVLVRAIEGKGELSDIPWDGLLQDASPAASDSVFVAQLQLSLETGSEAASARKSFGVGYGLPSAPAWQETLRGNFFKAGKKPSATAALKNQVGPLAKRIGKDDTVVVEVHADGTGDRLKTIARTQKEAELVKTALAAKGVLLGQIKARGRGSLAPILGTRSKADKAQNRRVVVVVTPKVQAQAGAPVPAPVTGVADALVAGQAATVDEALRFVKNVPTPADGRLLIDLVATDGRRAFVVVNVKGGPKSLAPAPKEKTVRVMGDVGTQALTVEGQPIDTHLLKLEALLQGFAPADEPNLALSLPSQKKRGKSPAAKPRRPALKKPVVFEFSVPTAFDASRWELSVWRAAPQGERELVYRQEAPSAPPSAAPWNGENDRGELVLLAGERYVYRLLVEDARGQRGFSPERTFTVGGGGQAGFAPISQSGTLFTKKGDPASSLKNRLARFASAIKGRSPTEHYRLVMQVFVPSESETERRLAMAQRKGKLKAYLAKLKIPVARVQIDAMWVAAAASKAERKDIVTITAVPVAKTMPVSVLVNGLAVPVEGTAFTSTATVVEGGTLLIDVTTTDGHRAIWALPVEPSPPEGAKKMGEVGRDRDGLLLPTQLGPIVQVATGLIAQAGGGLPRSRDQEERLDRGPALTLALAGDPTEFGGEELENALSDPEVVKARAEALAKARHERLIRDTKTGQMIELPRSIRAADWMVKLPPRGLKLRSPDLWVSGKTAKGNRLRINGAEHFVKSDGSFDELVTLPLGESTLSMESIDPDDNVAMISWPVEVSQDEHFLLLLADGALSTAYRAGQGGGFTTDGAELDGMSNHTTVSAGHVLLHGRVALYYKGRMSGGELFRRYRITGHVDTAKRGAFEEFFQEVLDPARDYAVYGDSADEVRDVNARGKLYVMVEADDSKLTVGNFKTQLKSGDLFRYDRAVYGAEVDFKKQWGSFKPEIKAFGTMGDGRLARDVNVFRATGGSLYYLRHGQIVEGGERIRVLVRDRDNGLVLAERQLLRDVDYTIDYAGGRVMFKSPISSVADASLLLDNFNSSQTPLDGHPVYVEATYDYSLDADVSAGAGGATLRGTFFDTLAVGAGFLGEARDGGGNLSDYTLLGADLSWKAKKRTTFRAELARSESSDAGNFLSSDGGLSFQGLDAIATTLPGGGRGGHMAWKLEVDSQLGDFARAEWAEATNVRLYAQDLDRGFSSGGTILEQGRTKFGGQAVHKVNANDTVSVRYDGERAELPRIGPQVENVARGLELDERYSHRATAAWARSGTRTDLRIEAAYQGVSTSAKLGNGDPQVDTHRLGVAGALGYRWSKRLVLRAGQEFTATLSDFDPTLKSVVRFQSTQDLSDPLAGIATTLGADWEMAKDLHVATSVALRWNGDTALLAGLKTPLDGNASMYMSERLEDRDGRLVSTSIVGGEQKFGASQGGKAYGEYQLESGVLGTKNRAVMGLGHRYSIRPGWNVAAGFEHQQTFGGFLPDGTPTGQNQRDVVHLGSEYVKRDNVKASASVELRFDDGMHGQPMSVPHTFETLIKSDPRAVAPSGTYADHGGTAPGAPLVLVPGEKLQLVAGAASDWIWNRDLTFLARFQIGQTWDITNRHTEGATKPTLTDARFLRATAGWAYRPLRIDWLDVLLQYSYLLDQRPIALAGGALENRSHVVALAPVALLPLRLQLSGKVAWKHTGSEAEYIEDQVLSSTLNLVLWLARVSYRFYGKWDLAGEFRVLALLMPQATERKHGALAEVDYVVSDRIRLGFGYNFSHFSDDELSDLTRDTHGFFFRVVGRY